MRRKKGGRSGSADRWTRGGSHNSKRGNTAQTAIAALAMAAAAVALPRTASATAYTWVPGEEFWNSTFAWSPNGVPGEENNDSASITDSTGTAETAVYDESVPDNIDDLAINLTGGAVGDTNTLQMELGFTLSSSFEFVGDSGTSAGGTGLIVQTNGANTAVFTLSLGFTPDDTGAYSLSGTGQLTATAENIGYSGTGVMNQSGGTQTVNSLYLGFNGTGKGSYDLSGGTINGYEVIEVGAAGSGTFTQSAGTMSSTVAGGAQLFVGTKIGSSGTYNQSGGSASFGYITVGQDSPGVYILSGTGVLTTASVEEIGYSTGSGTFTQDNNGFSNSLGAGGSLAIGVDGTGVYNLNSGDITSSGAITEIIGYFFGSGTFNQTGGFNIGGSASAALYVGYSASSTGVYNLSGGFLNIGTSTLGGYVGYETSGTFNQTGGTASFSGLDSNGNSLSIGDQAGGNGVYLLSAGVLEVTNDEHVGNDGNGSFTQTGGENSIDASLFIGGSSPSGGNGSYSLSLGTLSATGAEIVGWGGPGTFTQSGGTNINTGTLYVGDALNSNGIYSLSGGIITGGEEIVGRYGIGTFIQSGGTNSITAGQSLNIGFIDRGEYSVSGTGSLSVNGSVYVGGNQSNAGTSGTLSVNGGQMTVGRTLEVWNSSGTQATISGGTVTAGNTVNLATINVTGGSANLGAVTGTGTLNIGDASASVTASGLQQSSVSITSTGDLKLTGGGATNAVNSLVINTDGIFNLTSTRFIINYGTNPDPIAAIRGYLVSGYAGGAWTGTGIDSSTAALPANNAHYGIGYANGADGVVTGLTSGQIEIGYTLYGDANLDGLVNGDDFTILAANLGKTVAAWDQGDFNYDGTVNGDDFTLLVGNLGKAASGTDVELPASDYAAINAFAAANGLMADVPEPTMLSLLAISTAGVLLRGRRANRHLDSAAF